MPSSKLSRMFCWYIFSTSVLSLCLICSTILAAQGTGGRVLGRVTDPSGAALAGVKVTLTNPATNVTVRPPATAAATTDFPRLRWAAIA